MAKKLKVKAEKIEAIHLEAGDLYSLEGQDYWNEVSAAGLADFGMPLFMRTEAPVTAEMKDKTIYRIKIAGAYVDRNPKISMRMDPHNPPGVRLAIEKR